jgi:hypothetical protein
LAAGYVVPVNFLMGQTDFDEQRHIVLGVEETFQIAQQLGHNVGGRRNERRFVQRTAAGAEPILAAAQLAGSQMTAAYVLHQSLMDLPDQSHRNRQRRETSQPMIHGGDIVHDLAHVRRPIRREDSCLSSQQVLQRTLRPLDLARKDRFLADVHKDK